jgi:hypothetical protein
MTVGTLAGAGPEKSASTWMLAGDLSAGASLLLGPHGRTKESIARIWFTPEVGYGWMAPVSLGFSPVDSPLVVSSSRVVVEELALRGPFIRAQLAATF